MPRYEPNIIEEKEIEALIRQEFEEENEPDYCAYKTRQRGLK